MKDGILKLMYGMGMVIAVNIITPSGKYEKQVKFISALMFTVLVLNVFSDFSGFGMLKTHSANNNSYYAGEYDTGTVTDYIMEEYIHSLTEDMKNRLADFGNDVSADVSVITDINSPHYGQIRSVVIKNISEEYKDEAEKLINSFYGVDVSHISFYGNEE